MHLHGLLPISVAAFLAVAPTVAAQECPRLINRGAARVDNIKYSDGLLYVTFHGTHYERDSRTLAIFEPNGTAPPRFVAEVEVPRFFCRWGGAFTAVSDGIALVSSCRELAVFDVRDPHAPEQAAVLDFPAADGAISGHVGFLAARTAGMVVVDLSVPTRPRVISTLSTSGSVSGIAVAGHIAYLYDSSIGLRVLDVSDPLIPVEIGLVPLESGGGALLKAHGDHLFLVPVYGTHGFAFDIRQPEQPTIVAEMGAGSAMATDGRFLFIAEERPRRLTSYALEPGFPPQPLGVLDLDYSLRDFALVGDTVVATDSGGALTVIDVRHPTNPVLARVSPAFEGAAIAVDRSTEFAFLATDFNYGSQFLAVDFSDPRQLQTFDVVNKSHSKEDVVAFGRDVSVREGVAVTAGQGRIAVFDVTDPSAPEYRRSLEDLGAIHGLASAPMMVLAATSAGLVMVDVSDPDTPTEVGRYTGATPTGVVANGNVAFLACEAAGLRVVDLSNPAAPVEIAAVPGDVSTLALSDDLLFVGHDALVRVLDISDPTQPIELSRFDVAGPIIGIGADGRWLVVAAKHLTVVDVLDPASPHKAGWSSNTLLELARRVKGEVQVAGELALVGRPGLAVFDLSDCSGPPIPWARFRWLPPIVPAPTTSVHFTDTSLGNPISWQWDFGDGYTSKERHPTHTFPEAGSYQVTLTVTSPHGTDTTTQALSVRGDPDDPPPPITVPRPWAAIVPAAAHVPGIRGTSWFTDLVVYNPRPYSVEAALFFLSRGADSSESTGHWVRVPANASVLLADVVGDVLQHGEGAGGVLVTSDERLIVSSRSFNQAGNHVRKETFGQRLAATPLDQALACGDEGYLVHLVQSQSTRTNLGFANPSASRIDVEVEVRSPSGDTLGRQWHALEPYSTMQQNHFMRTMGIAPIEDAYAVVRCLTEGASIVPYASVIDAVTGDPTTIDITRPGTDPVHLMGVAHLAGANSTTWRTDVVVVNPTDQPARVRLELVLEGRSPADSLESGIEPGSTLVMADVVESVFGRTGKGTLRIVPLDGEILAQGRTYTIDDTEGGTYGLTLPPLYESDAVLDSDPGILLQLATSPDPNTGFRTNVGLLALTAASVSVEFVLSDGTPLGTIDLDLEIDEFLQLNHALSSVAPLGHSSVVAYVRTDAPDERVLAYASVVDNRSGDPMFIPAVPLE
jgi:PKD repeat protein